MADELCPPPTDDDDLTLPRASINKMIKELVGGGNDFTVVATKSQKISLILQVPNLRVANESRELIMNCCTEFIHLISSEANEICKQNNKKTINAEHVLAALEKLGFADYKDDATAVLIDCKEVAANRRRQSTRLENLGIPEEELLRQQQELFARAREEQAALDQAQFQALNMNLSAGTHTGMMPPTTMAQPAPINYSVKLQHQSPLDDPNVDEYDDD